MGAQSTVIMPEPLRSIDSATFTGSFQAVGTPLANSSRIIKFINNSTVPVTISWDGINAHDFVPPTSFVLYDVSTNRGKPSPYLSIRQRTQFYVSGSAGSGLFYIVTLYAFTPTPTIPI